MKRILSISAAALLCGAMMVSAKTADQLRIYLNPGHGSWTSNDRPMKTLKEVDGQLTVIDPKTEPGTKVNSPDTTAFYESNTNLRKMYAVLDKLESYGLKFDRTKNQTNSNPYRVGAALDLSNNIVMSHVKAGPFPHDPNNAEVYNRALSEIRQEVEVNNFDMFFSLHSNASTDGSTVNYHAIFYRGWYSNQSYEDARAEYLRKLAEIQEKYKDDPDKLKEELKELNKKQVDERGSGDSQDTPDFAKGSIDMAKAAAKYTLGMAHQHWTARTNDAVGSGCVIGDAEFQHQGTLTTNNGTKYHGYYGVLKHGVPGYLAEGYFHTYQPSRQRAMNWDADRMEGYQFVRGIADYFGLTKETTGDIYGVVRDINQSFHHTYYTPQGSTNDKYLPLNGVTVVLKDAEGKEVDRLVTDNFYNGVYVFADLEPGTYTVELEKEGYKMVDGENYTVEVKAATTSYPEAWMIDANWEPPTVTYYDYEDPLADVAQVGAAGEYVMEQIYTDEAVAELDGLNIRRTILRNGNLYVLGFDADNAPVIKVLDAKTREVKATVSTEGTTGAVRGVGDIALTADGVLVAVNADDNLPFGGAAKVEMYRWENDEAGLPAGAPVLMGATNHAGNWNAAEFGKTMAYKGTIASGSLYFANKSTANNNTRIEIVNVEDGVVGAFWHENFNSMTGKAVTDADLGDYQWSVSPLNEDCLVFTAEKCTPFEVKLSGKSAGVPTLGAEIPAGMLEGTGFRGQFFKVAGEVFFVAPTTDADGNNTGVQVLNVTAGLDKAKVVTTTNTTLAVPEVSTQSRGWAEVEAGVPSVNGAITVKRNANTDAYESHALDLYLTRGNGQVTRFSTEGIEQPVTRANFAYDLAQAEVDNAYTLTFKSTGAAPEANLILTNVDNADDVMTIALGAVALGENTVTVNASDLADETSYNWAIEIVDNPVAAAGKFYNQKRAMSNGVAQRGGVVMITDPEQESFGTIMMALGNAQGIDVFTPALELQGNYHKNAPTMVAGNGSSLMRGGERDGKAVFIDWSDGGAGYWQFDPKDQSLTNILAGTKDGGGAYTLDGVAIGGGATAFEVAGKGEDEKIYVFCEDYPAADGNNFIRYSSAGKSIIDMAPDQVWDGTNGFSNIHGKYANINVEINAIPQGLILSQNRNNANSKGCPCFEIYKYDGTLLLSSADDDYVDFYHSVSGGIAATADGNVMAVPTWGNGIMIVDIDWTDAEKPVLNHRYTIPAPSAGTSAEYTQMIFDPAGNLYAFDRALGLQMFVLKNSAPKALTPARSEFIVKGGNSGVEDVRVEAAANEAPVEYFDLQGRRILEPAAGSVVIRRQGADVQKIVIR